jgi:acyl dehydratase
MNAGLLLKALFKKPANAGTARDALHSSYEVGGIDPGQVRRYGVELGFRQQGIPVTFYYLLAQRAHLATMLDRPFPYRIPGIIHVDNTLQEHASPDSRSPLRLDTTASILPPAANGAVHCLFETKGLQAGKLVFTCSSTYLAVRGQRGAKTGSRHADTPAPPDVASWKLAPSSGRAYASVSGDWNPIHLWPLTARLMGLNSPIIHGMHTVAKACAALEDLSGQPLTLISARFKAPIPLPGEVHLAANADSGTYVVSCGGRPAVEGSFATVAVPRPAPAG